MPKWFAYKANRASKSQFSFSSSARPFMIAELVLVVPRSTGLDSKNKGPPRIQTGGRLKSGGCSSVGRAPDLHSGGRRFDPDQLHQLQVANGFQRAFCAGQQSRDATTSWA